jgi:hypothetical protein
MEDLLKMKNVCVHLYIYLYLTYILGAGFKNVGSKFKLGKEMSQLKFAKRRGFKFSLADKNLFIDLPEALLTYSTITDNVIYIYGLIWSFEKIVANEIIEQIMTNLNPRRTWRTEKIKEDKERGYEYYVYYVDDKGLRKGLLVKYAKPIGVRNGYIEITPYIDENNN